jgi:hypothetical protein
MCFDPHVQVRALWLSMILLGAAPVASAAAQASKSVPPSSPPSQTGRARSLGVLFGAPGSNAGAASNPATRAAPDPEWVELARRLAVLAGRPDAQLVSFAIEHGQRALGAASIALRDGQPKAARRAKKIVWAALDLAANVLARNGAQAAERAAQRRAVTAEQARDEQRRAVVLLQQRLVATRSERP